METHSQMKVVHTVGSIDVLSGGLARAVIGLCDALHRTSDVCDPIAVTAAPCPGSANVECQGYDSHELPRGAKTRDYARRIRESIPDLEILHDNGQWLPVNRASARVAKELGKPRIVTPHGMLTPWALNHHRFRKSVAWSLFAKRHLFAADVLHATSELELSELRDLGLEHPIAVIPNGIDEEWFADVVPTSRSEDGLSTAVFLSRIHKKKGVAELVNGWRRVAPPNWRLRIAGNDDEGLLDELELPDGCEFVGYVDGEVRRDLMASADLFVLPTYSENFGIVIAEAMACGLPVITTDQAPWKCLEEHNAGWVTHTGVEAFSAALREATGMSLASLKAMGENGRRFVEREYRWDNISNQMISVYRWMIGQADRPDCVFLK